MKRQHRGSPPSKIRVHLCPSVVRMLRRMDYEPAIGLETHVQLKTKSKMWCGCANEFGAPPNTNVCPVCLGLPGVLPVANEEALRLTALTGLLLTEKFLRRKTVSVPCGNVSPFW